MVSDDPPAVDVVRHPGEVHQGSEDTLQVDVVAEYQPEAEARLTQTEDCPENHPGQHESSHVIPDAPDEEDGGDEDGGEHDDAEVSGVLGVTVDGSLE